jgi:hypothetical protein
MKFNSPLPQTLPKECQKAAKIREFGLFCNLRFLNISDHTVSSFADGKNNGLDGVSGFLIQLPCILDRVSDHTTQRPAKCQGICDLHYLQSWVPLLSTSWDRNCYCKTPEWM